MDAQKSIIITDFGFANISSQAKDGILQTSCGSPCYAAPELVINDGYVGEAADIWSCGVILVCPFSIAVFSLEETINVSHSSRQYAMLCGYLPFDDDPANPDGENITRLYKYILETKLDFPEHVSPSAKHLMKRILVPDPAKRATLREIIQHPCVFYV